MSFRSELEILVQHLAGRDGRFRMLAAREQERRAVAQQRENEHDHQQRRDAEHDEGCRASRKPRSSAGASAATTKPPAGVPTDRVVTPTERQRSGSHSPASAIALA